MRWLADECVAAPLVASLRNAGHDVAYVIEAERRASDSQVAAVAEAEGRLLLTEDKDFGELVVRQLKPVPGLVLLRMDTGQPQLRWKRLETAIGRFGDELFGRITVIDDRRIRSRRLPERR